MASGGAELLYAWVPGMGCAAMCKREGR